VARLILGQTGLQLTLGMAIGVGLSLLLGQGLSFVLFDVAATDGFVLAGVAALLTVTAVVACLVPVRRATKVDPLVAMQSE
jgi:putative ABC transport system permease protein